ncbi:MAG TPA: hypothetical protein VEX18_17165 [Polyangiaceae bacterium]|nr:hypothetical protein [Polyangiaceae bacterium]
MLRSRIAASTALVVAAVGCLNPNLYTSPRATPVARSAILVAPQMAQQTERVQSYGPVVGLRYGVMPRLDVGMRSNFGSLAADVKWNAIRTSHFDLALDGGVEFLPHAFYAHVPLLMGFNVAEHLSLLASTGVTLGSGEQPTPFGSVSTTDPVIGGGPVPAGRPFVRSGLGVQLRFTPTFAVQPEVTALYYLGDNEWVRNYYAGGIGFVWSRSPY